MKTVSDMNMSELAAYVCSHLLCNGIEVVLSGGACVSLYTAGQYVSYDLDFIENLSSGRRKLKKILEQIGFHEEGRYFKHPETDYFLEFPPGPLAVGDEPPQQISILTFATGQLKALSPTDCLKDRLSAYYHWNDRQCLEQAILIAKSQEVDISEVERWSKGEGQLEKFAEFLGHTQ